MLRALRAHVHKLHAESAVAEALLVQAKLPKANWSWPGRARLRYGPCASALAFPTFPWLCQAPARKRPWSGCRLGAFSLAAKAKSELGSCDPMRRSLCSVLAALLAAPSAFIPLDGLFLFACCFYFCRTVCRLCYASHMRGARYRHQRLSAWREYEADGTTDTTHVKKCLFLPVAICHPEYSGSSLAGPPSLEHGTFLLSLRLATSFATSRSSRPESREHGGTDLNCEMALHPGTVATAFFLRCRHADA